MLIRSVCSVLLYHVGLASVHIHAGDKSSLRSNQEPRQENVSSTHLMQTFLSAPERSKSDNDTWSAPTCSPVCADALDVVAVIGASQKSLSAQDVVNTRQILNGLVEHFALSRAHGSLFGVADLSGGLANVRVLSQLTANKGNLLNILKEWNPQLGDHPTLPAGQESKLEEHPLLLAMLSKSRPQARRALLLVGQVVAPSNAQSQNKLMTGSNTTVVFMSPTDGAQAFPAEDNAVRKTVVNLLLSLCPAVAIDSDLECGRMRWGHASNHSKLRPFGAETNQ